MKLIVAEKPSVARNINEAIRAKGMEHDYIVTACAGHLCGLAMPGDYNESLQKWTLSSLPILPERFQYKVIEQKQKLFSDVKKLMNDSRITGIINACDGDREGELIFRLVYELAGCKKPVERLWVSSQEPQAILAGMKLLKPMSEYDSLCYAAKCREIADWLLGINLSRLYTLSLRAPKKITVGRVQTPTVQMVCQREQEIREFKPKDYWNVVANLGTFDVSRRFDVEAEAIDICRTAPGSNAIIQDVVKTNKSESAPKLYDLTSLQQDCNKMFGLSAADTLATLQSLYEEKLATYPRTGSRYITSKDYDLAQQVILATVGNGSLIPPGTKAAQDLKLQNVVNDKKVEGHPALLPTVSGVKEFPKLTGKKRQVLGLILYRLLEATAPARKYLSTKISALICDLVFTAKGSVELSPGWREMEAIKKKVIPIGNEANTEKKSSDNDDQELPDVKKGESYPVKKVNRVAKKTSPPPRYTEASLLSAMESCGKKLDDEELREAMKDRGLGTPATRASIIEKIIWTESNLSGYITRGRLDGKKWVDTKHLYPTESAEHLMAILPPMVKAPETTGEWEHSLTEIQKNELKPQKFVLEIEEFVKKLVIDTQQHPFSDEQCNSIAGSYKKMYDTLCECPVCGKDIVSFTVKKDKEGNALPKPKTGYRCLSKNCFIISDNISGKKLSPSQIKKLLRTGSTGVLNGFTSKKTGKAFSAEIVMEKDDNGKLTGKCKFALPERKALCLCPICGHEIKPFRFERFANGTKKKEVFQGWGCTNRECRLGAFYNPCYGRTFNEEEVKKLFEQGETDVLQDFVSQNGKKNAAKICMALDPNEKNKLTGKYTIEWVGEDMEICKCPVCENGNIRRWHSARGNYSGYKCDNPDCNMKPLFDGLAGHEFKPEEVYALFTTGHTETITDFKSKKGKTFSARVSCSFGSDGKINGKDYKLEF